MWHCSGSMIKMMRGIKIRSPHPKAVRLKILHKGPPTKIPPSLLTLNYILTAGLNVHPIWGLFPNIIFDIIVSHYNITQSWNINTEFKSENNACISSKCIPCKCCNQERAGNKIQLGNTVHINGSHHLQQNNLWWRGWRGGWGCHALNSCHRRAVVHRNVGDNGVLQYHAPPQKSPGVRQGWLVGMLRTVQEN